MTHAKQTYQLVDPTTEPQAPEFTSAPRLTDLADKRVGFIDDSKENAKELLQAIEAVLRQRHGIREAQYHRKPSASKPADSAVVERMAKQCDYVVVAIGS
jgi:nucleotide-binding universal stress UspA family protein